MRGKDVLTCRKGRCAPSTRTTVLLVSTVASRPDGDASVGVTLFMPPEPGSEFDGRIRAMVVRLRKNTLGWEAYKLGDVAPFEGTVKLPPP